VAETDGRYRVLTVSARPAQ